MGIDGKNVEISQKNMFNFLLGLQAPAHAPPPCTQPPPPGAPVLSRSPGPSARGEHTTGTEHTRVAHVAHARQAQGLQAAHQEQPGWLSPGPVPPSSPQSPQKLSPPSLHPCPMDTAVLGALLRRSRSCSIVSPGCWGCADVGGQTQPEVVEDPKSWVWDGCPLFLGACQGRAWVSEPALVEKCGLRSFWSCSGGHHCALLPLNPAVHSLPLAQDVQP